MEAIAHNPEGVARPAGTYSQAVIVRTGRVVYISGQPPISADGKTVEGDFEAQATQVFENLRAILEDLGGSLADLVKLTIFLKDIGDYAKFGQVRSRYLRSPYPACTLVAVSHLVSPEWLLEVEGIAALEDESG